MSNCIYSKAQMQMFTRHSLTPDVSSCTHFRGHTTATITYRPPRMEEPLTNGRRINSRQTTGAGCSKEDLSGCQDWAQWACHTHGMLSQRGYPCIPLKSATGGTSGLPATAPCIQLWLRLFVCRCILALVWSSQNNF